MTTRISLIAKLTAAEGRADELKAALADLIAAADEEDGLEVYSAHAAADDDHVVYFFEVYRDAEALAAHGGGERMRPAMKALGAFLDGRAEVTRLTPLVAKGLEV